VRIGKEMIRLFLSLIIVCIPVTSKGDDPHWTWLLKKVFSEQERHDNGEKSKLVFTRTELPPFTQMIFSWNAQMPSQGYFVFWAQARNVVTKQWYNWHKMIVWGVGIQQSFFSDSLKGTTYHHVRLEIPEGAKADGIRIKIEAHDKATLTHLYALAVNISDFEKFESEDPLAFKSLPTIRIRGIPSQSQMVLDHPKREVLCSPTSCSMVIGYFMKKCDPIECAYGVYDAGLDAYGSWPFNTAYAFNKCDKKIFFHVCHLNSFKDLYAYLHKKIPIIVSVRGPLEGAPLPYQQGHLLVVVGWDHRRQRVVCHDPAFDSNEKVAVSYSLHSFLQAWERSKRLAYIAIPQ
jgi:hypothetical protein